MSDLTQILQFLPTKKSGLPHRYGPQSVDMTPYVERINSINTEHCRYEPTMLSLVLEPWEIPYLAGMILCIIGIIVLASMFFFI